MAGAASSIDEALEAEVPDLKSDLWLEPGHVETSKKLQLSLDDLIDQQGNAGYRAVRKSRKANARGGRFPPMSVPPPPPPMLHGDPALQRELMRRQALVHNSRFLRAQPYDALMVTDLRRQQLITDLLLQRKTAQLLASRPDGKVAHPRRKIEDSLAAAEKSALADTEILYPVMIAGPDGVEVASPDVSLIVRFKGTDVLTVRKARGDLVLNSGTWRTISTLFVLNNALRPIGLWIEEIPSPDEKPPEWRVVDGSSYLASFHDGMVISSVGATSRAQLLARASVIGQHLKQVKSNMTKKSRPMTD